MLSHGAIVAREFGIPCVVGVQHATRELFRAGQIEVDGDQGKVHVFEALHKSHSACEAGVSIKPGAQAPGSENKKALRAREAGGSIKPGAQAPGSDHKRQAGARETGDSVKFSVFRPLSRAPAFLFGTLTWGLRPRLYAYACYRRLRNFIRFRLFEQSLSSIKLIYAYWRERYSISVFLPFAILIAAAGAAAGGSLPPVRDAWIGCVLAYTLVLVFRIGDDLADLSSDRLRHPGRVLVQDSECNSDHCVCIGDRRRRHPVDASPTAAPALASLSFSRFHSSFGFGITGGRAFALVHSPVRTSCSSSIPLFLF